MPSLRPVIRKPTGAASTAVASVEDQDMVGTRPMVTRVLVVTPLLVEGTTKVAILVSRVLASKSSYVTALLPWYHSHCASA